jgi:type II secretory pathway pseudopilin PulG
MMKKIFHYAILPVVMMILAGSNGHAQVMPKSFSNDPVKFIDELSSFFDSYDKKEGKDFIEDFEEKYWKNGRVTEDIKTAMYANTNLMLKKKFRPAPEYYSYINTIKAIVDKNVAMPTFLDWQSCFTSVGGGKLAKPFSDFILMSESLFGENKFYKTASGEWTTMGGSWKFVCDSVPSIKFTNVTLKGVAKHDSTSIYNTTGTYFPTTGTWKGKGGRVNWQRAGLKPEEMYADLRNYSITVKSFAYTADSVTFYDKGFFKDKPLLGRLSEKLIADAQEKTANYPRFESYSNRYQIKSIYPNVDYEGGFTQVGAKFIGSGSKENPAFFTFNRNGKPFLTVRSTEYLHQVFT